MVWGACMCVICGVCGVRCVYIYGGICVWYVVGVCICVVCVCVCVLHLPDKIQDTQSKFNFR